MSDPHTDRAPEAPPRTLTDYGVLILRRQDWWEEGRDRYGTDLSAWGFRCVACGEEQTPADFMAHGMSLEVAFETAARECIGRHDSGRGCDWALYGLLHIHRLAITCPPDEKPIAVLDFASRPLNPKSEETDG